MQRVHERRAFAFGVRQTELFQRAALGVIAQAIFALFLFHHLQRAVGLARVQFHRAIGVTPQNVKPARPVHGRHTASSHAENLFRNVSITTLSTSSNEDAVSVTGPVFAFSA